MTLTDEQIQELALKHSFGSYRGVLNFARALLSASIADIACNCGSAGAMEMNDKIKYFLDAWEMNGVGNTVAKVQDGPGTVVTITVDDLRALLAAGASEGQAVCVDCGDTIMAHDPGTCGNCHSMKYVPASAESERIAGMEKDAERYRKVRSMASSDMLKLSVIFIPEDFDEFVNAAIAKEQK